jgi:outer membrane scaffolding protein for murein synthesis (MipA/OmpV family)
VIRCWRAILLLAAAGCSLGAQAYHLPRWELGVGVAALRLPAYRGAEGSEDYLLPFPYLTYRGDRLRVDEEGMRTRLFDRERWRLDFSLAGNLPVKSEPQGVRAGMPALDPIGEIGPTLDWSAWRTALPGHEAALELWLRAPLRAAFSVGDPLLDHHGWVFSPSIELVYRQGSERSLSRWSLSAGPLYATQDFHRYFYEVAPAYASASRPAYAADGGYAGARVTLSYVVNRQNWFVGAFARYDDLGGAVFADSPLVESSQYFALGLAVSRVFAASRERVAH